MVEKIQIEDIEITFALRGISPVSRNSLIRLPKNLFWTTKLYSLSDDLTKKLAARMSQIVPGSPGTKYPIIPSVRNTKPNEIKMNFFSLASSPIPPIVRFYFSSQLTDRNHRSPSLRMSFYLYCCITVLVSKSWSICVSV